MKSIAAIDPGAMGGIAWLNPNETIEAIPMPKTMGDVSDQIRSLKVLGIQMVVIEEVGGYAGVGMPGSAMFNFGSGYGFILGCCAAFGLPVHLVRPQKWQKHFSLGTVASAGGKTAWKNKLKTKAQQFYPDQDVTLKTADALLLLSYGQQNCL